MTNLAEFPEEGYDKGGGGCCANDDIVRVVE
jgi:hypothetical protein